MSESAEPAMPILAVTADKAAVAAQRKYFTLARTELLAMFVASLAPIFSTVWVAKPGEIPVHLALAGAAVSLALLASVLERGLKFQDQWYAARALAESMKTETWRYSMRAGAYTGTGADAEAAYVETMQSLITAEVVAPFRARIPGDLDPTHVTDAMRASRSRLLAQRVETYVKYRIRDQYTWYRTKAAGSLKAAERWQLASIFIQVGAVILIFIVLTNPTSVDAIGAAMTAAASALAWANMKDFRFHASSYANIADELSRQANLAPRAKTEAFFVQLVDDVEHTISREHTMWVVRKR